MFFFKQIYKVAWIFCVISVLYTSQLPGTKAAAVGPVSTIYTQAGESSFPGLIRHREKRQLNSYLWNNGLLQGLSQTLSDTVGRIREVVRSGTASDTPLLRMVNDFRTRLAPLILRTFYTTTVQNVWNEIRDRARSSVNEFFDRIGNDGNS